MFFLSVEIKGCDTDSCLLRSLGSLIILSIENLDFLFSNLNINGRR